MNEERIHYGVCNLCERSAAWSSSRGREVLSIKAITPIVVARPHLSESVALKDVYEDPTACANPCDVRLTAGKNQLGRRLRSRR